MTKTIPVGIYKHYKGKEYLVMHIAKHSETEERLVVYRCLYGKYDVWVRPLKMFIESVMVNDEPVPRFEFIRVPSDIELEKLSSRFQ
ncbi:DUF1653 domain-containing protein [Sessilibacter sp. MAH2]